MDSAKDNELRSSDIRLAIINQCRFGTPPSEWCLYGWADAMEWTNPAHPWCYGLYDVFRNHSGAHHDGHPRLKVYKAKGRRLNR